MIGAGIKEIRVRVTPNSKREYVETSAVNTLRVGVNAPTESNQANDRVREVLAGHFSVPVKNVMIIKGMQSPSKIVRIYGV